MTILFTPNSYASAHSDLFYTVNDAKASDPVSFPNYKYVADIYINGNFITRLRRFPDPVFNNGMFNVSAIVRAYVSAVFAPNSSILAMEFGQSLFNIDLQIKFGEEYGVTTTYNIVTDSTRKIYNYYVRLQQGNTAPLSTFTNKIVTNGFKANNYLSTFKATLSTDFLFVSYLATTTSPVTISITGHTTYTTTVTPASANNLLIFNVSPVIASILQPGIVSNLLDFYTVTIGGDIIRIKLFCEAMHNVYPLHFLTQYGGFETAIFSKVSKQNISIDRKSFSALPYKMQADGSISYRNNLVYNESSYNYVNTYTDTLTLNTDILSDKEYIWLEDLIESPLVYIQMLGFFYPVKITTNDYEIKKAVNETDLNNLTITVDLGKTFNTQFR